jgi:hypothetical protein
MMVGRAAGGWVRDLKRGLGYYRLRTRLLAPLFARALRPTDVFLVGHPKSGNTWLAYMLAVLIERDAAGRVNLANVGQVVPFVHGKDHRIARYAHLADPRVFRNEYPRYLERYPRIIYLLRDPRSVLPSLWQMYRTMRADETIPIESFLEQYLDHRGIFRSWNSELVRWDRQVDAALDGAAGDGRIAVVRYEEMRADRQTVLARLSGFIGLERAGSDLEMAADRGTFQAMQQIEDQHGAEAYRGRAAGAGRFVRVGTTDSWRRELPPASIARIESALGPAMRRAGYLT